MLCCVVCFIRRGDVCTRFSVDGWGGVWVSDEVNVEYWTAYWHCPKCNCLGDDCDDGAEDNGDTINVTCYECGHKYDVIK